MNNNNDIIEDLSLNQTVTPNNVSSDNEVLTTDDMVTNNNVTPQVDNNTSLGDNEYSKVLSEVDKEYATSSGVGKKKAIIIILSILLVLDVAALIIYLIGIDKVFSFIK